MAYQVKVAERVSGLPQIYIFRELAGFRKQLKEKGKDVINLGIGTPDLPTPKKISYAISEGFLDPYLSEGYPDDKHPYRATESLAEAISSYYERKGVHVPAENIVVDFGAKPITHMLPRVFANNGDYVALMDPKYPAFEAAVRLADALPLPLPCTPENDYVPDLSGFDYELKDTAAAILCYPNNPTGATINLQNLYELCSKLEEKNIPVISDEAYADFCYDGQTAPSALQTGCENIISVGSFSKPYNMTGHRVGWLASTNSELVNAIVKVKSQIDSGVCNALQKGAVVALTDPEVELERKRNMDVYKGRRDSLFKSLQNAGIECRKPDATPYFWCTVPEGFKDSREFVWELGEVTGVVGTPGGAFGKYGEGYFRITVFQPEGRLTEAVGRIEEFLN